MAHDPELVELVAAWLQNGRHIMGHRVMWPVEGGDPAAQALAQNLLDTINASGTHWVAPWEYTPEMERALSDIEEHWGELRGVYLAERKGDEK